MKFSVRDTAAFYREVAGLREIAAPDAQVRINDTWFTVIGILGPVTLAEDLAHRAALAVDNARLYQEAQRANRATAIPSRTSAR